MSGDHQLCKIGSHGFGGATSLVLKDIPPFVMASGNSASPFGLNSEGLKRRGFDKETILNVRRAYKILYRQGLHADEAIEKMQDLASQTPQVADFANFVKDSARGIIR